MFSSRLDWSVAANPIAKLLIEQRNSGAEILDLTESNPTAAGFEYPAGVLAALADPRSLRYEPIAAGLHAAREAIADYYGGQVDLARSIITPRTTDAYGFNFKAPAQPRADVVCAP